MKAVRPTISLCCILKNEHKNLPRLLASVRDCFDEIHLTDTGSTDGSVELITEWAIEDVAKNPANTPIILHHFKWIDDFSAARNYSFSHATTDYVMWLDLDDVLSDAKAFIDFRDEAMAIADMWMATYHYALDAKGLPTCSFARERIVRTSLGLQWHYFVHEGILPVSKVKPNLGVHYAPTWSVKHLRDEDDLKQDRSRNLHLFERAAKPLSSRMRYYYGKELFENQKPLEAFQELINAIAEPDLEQHDRVMGVQYACLAAAQLNQFEKATQLALQGLLLAPQRAEFFCIIGDCLIKQNRFQDAPPYYEAALRCNFQGDSPIQGPVFQHGDSYRHYPVLQMARVAANMGNIPEARRLLDRAIAMGQTAETIGMKAELEKIVGAMGTGMEQRKKTTDIVITCPPGTLYPWDHKVYAEQGVGGSETAACEMATWLSRLTGNRVIIFNAREAKATFGKVEFWPTSELPAYFRDFSPLSHIAWRHTMKLSDDPMYIWCHDLAAPGIENHRNYEKVMALSPFHRGYLKNLFGIPEDKIVVTRNGIEPKRFATPVKRAKEYGKVVYSSSPDRGLDYAIQVMDEVVKAVPEAKLHIYYGFSNMEKLGHKAEVERIQKLMAGKEHIVYHGNLPQDELTEELESACVWLYPTNFLETFCITSIEMLCSGVYPVTRRWGALQNTLETAEALGMATLLETAGDTPENVSPYVREVVHAILDKKWERVLVDPSAFSWKSVAEEWLEILQLGRIECPKLPLSNSMRG